MTPIQMVFYENTGIKLIPTNAYKPYFDNRWAIIARLCWWFLRKTSSILPHFDESMGIKQITIDKNQAASHIVRMAMDQLNQLWHQTPKKILLGMKEFNSCVNEGINTRIQRPFEFEIQLKQGINTQLSDGEYDTSYKVYSVPVQVIPWMEGILVL